METALIYALNDTQFDLAVFDAMGHGIQAALVSSLAVGSYRHVGPVQSLQRMHTSLDQALDLQFQGTILPQASWPGSTSIRGR